jgi:hypothetical protein
VIFRSIDIQKGSCRILVQAKNVLRSENSSDAAGLCGQLCDELKLKVSRDATTLAEDLVEFLYFAGSLIGATVSGPLAIPSSRLFSRFVYTACLAVS